MNPIRLHHLVIAAVLAQMLISVEVARINQNPQPHDLLGGASLIFKRPQNPRTYRRKTQQRSSPAVSPQEKSTSSASPQSNDDLSDKVEDAIALGNAARDRTPPDFASAEKAYLLAWKLDPSDPRSYVGLGNVYYDQQKYPEAAKAYREAIARRPTTRGPQFLGGVSSRESGTRAINVELGGQIGEWHVYLATAMLQQENPIGAEMELRLALAYDSKKAVWRAQLGYALFTQKRYTEASAAYESAVQLDPNNDTYKQLLKQSSLEARGASAQDGATAKQLEDSKWEIREAVTGSLAGTCRLRSKQLLDCKFNGHKLRLYRDLRWKVQDGLLELERASTPWPACVGDIRGDRVYLKCPSPERDEVWTKQSRN